MTDAQVIEALGGHIEVAAWLRRKKVSIKYVTETVRHWAQGRPIPWQYRQQIKAMARGRKVKLPQDFLWKRT